MALLRPCSGLTLVALLLAVLGAVGCQSTSDSGSTAGDINGPVVFLTSGNLDGEEDDPAVAVDGQGTIFVVWFSDRDGTRDLYAVHSTAINATSGFITWSSPIQITNNALPDFEPPSTGDHFPSLTIDAAGTHHLAWHRWQPDNASHILYAKSDGTQAGWENATVVPVTSGANFDRFPNIVPAAANDLRIYFASTTRNTPNKNDIFVATSVSNGDAWQSPTEVPSLNSVTEQSSLPTVLRLPNGSFVAALQRFKLNPSNDVLDPSSDIFFAESANGATWSVDQVTSDPGDFFNDLAPSLFIDHAGAVRLAWGATQFGDPTGDLVQMPAANRASFPGFVGLLTAAIGTPDHSPRLIPLTVDGRPAYVMVWVRMTGAPPHNQVVYRMFSRL
jgi:hypothetical protein